MRYNIIICAILKDETPYLIEWVEHHLQIGVEHFVLYDNNSIIPAKKTLVEKTVKLTPKKRRKLTP